MLPIHSVSLDEAAGIGKDVTEGAKRERRVPRSVPGRKSSSFIA
jgi:hypothetical protein